MKITRIEVENFKSIQNYDFQVESFNVFIGKNNHGKTNLFDALDWFDSGKTQSANYRDNNKDHEIKVRIHFAGVQQSIGLMPEGRHKAAMQNALKETDNIVVEKSSADDKRFLTVNGVAIGNPTGFDAALNYFLPKIIYVTTKNRLSDVSGYKSKSPIADMLSDVLKDMVDSEPKYKTFVELFDELFNQDGSTFRIAVDNLETKVESYLSKQFAEGAGVRFHIENPAIEDMLKNFETEIDDGVVTKAENKGDGMQRAVMLAIVQAYADYRKEKGVARNFVFLIDEAELHLHPTAQRSLKNALRDIVDQGGQVLINSHSSIFANERFANHKIFMVNKDANVSNITEVITEQQQLDSIYQLLGGSPNDILLPSNFIIVEGQTEAHFINKIIERFYSGNKKCSAIKTLFARGDHERQRELYHSIHECYKPLFTNGVYKNTIVFLLDEPDPAKRSSYGDFRTAHPWLMDNEHIHMLPVPAIEMYYPPAYRKTKAEVDQMNGKKDKINLAIQVAYNITEEEFRREMPIIAQMIEKAIELAYE